MTTSTAFEQPHACHSQEGFYISPAFLDKLSIHVAKNFLELPKIKVPLILGIWGGKGQGKTFQVCARIRGSCRFGAYSEGLLTLNLHALGRVHTRALLLAMAR